jgi:hypothetical protein
VLNANFGFMFLGEREGWLLLCVEGGDSFCARTGVVGQGRP